MAVAELGLVLTVVVMLGVVALILLYERKRARGIQEDLRRMAEDDPGDRGEGPRGP
jgi:hypothetical protein